MLKHVVKAEKNATFEQLSLSPAISSQQIRFKTSQCFRKASANSGILGRNNPEKSLRNSGGTKLDWHNNNKILSVNIGQSQLYTH